MLFKFCWAVLVMHMNDSNVPKALVPGRNMNDRYLEVGMQL
jgi:hypothetical protein